MITFENYKYQLKPSQEKILNYYKNNIIKHIIICRKPINNNIMTLFNILSLGVFKKNLENSPYDKLFHLSIYLLLDNNIKLVLEKNERVNLYIDNNYINNEMDTFNIDINNIITLEKLYNNSLNKIGKDNFFIYKADSWNCQNFIYNILLNNDLIDEEIKEFILQDTKYLFKNLDYLKKLSNNITDYALKMNIIYSGGNIIYNKDNIKKNEENDLINNWYDKLKNKNDDEDYNKKPIGFDKHYIYNNSHILSIGGTGSGKTNSLCEYLFRANGNFYDIIIFTSIDDEFLYKKLKKLLNITIINDIDDLIPCKDYDYSEIDKNKPKLLIIDDFINIPKKYLTKIRDYLTYGRKLGWSCYLQAQNYTQVDKTIVRNINYFIIYKLNDNITINNIIRNHNIDNTKKDIIINMYVYCTKNKFNFFMIDLKNDDKKYRYRKNFLEFLNISNFN